MKLTPKGAVIPPPNPQATDRLVAALDVVLAASDAISNCVRHFSDLAPDAPIPPAWVDRAALLHVQALEAWWALDDEAAIDAAAGGWTVGPPHAIGGPVERRYTRTRWETELMKPNGYALWWDRLIGQLDTAAGFGTTGGGSEAEVEEAGRALVREGARRRYAAWTNAPKETT